MSSLSELREMSIDQIKTLKREREIAAAKETAAAS